MDDFILGIWDGHDAGAALLKGDQIVFALSEERLSRRKLEVGFPVLSIKACLEYAGLSPNAIREIAASTSDPAKTLTRLVPRLKEEYYLIRRRKKRPGRLDPLKKRFKYRFTELGPNVVSRYLSRSYLGRQLRSLGFENFNLHLLDHHECHAQGAARSSGFDDCLVITFDGVGDGLSGSIWRFRNNRLEPVKKLPAKVSFGIFFEHVTNLMNMRELEDEGKVMALSNYAYPIEDGKNPVMELVQTKGLEIVSRYSSVGLLRELKKILWQHPSEQFAYMAQKALEKHALELVQNSLTQFGAKKVALAGGVFSNIKLNMKIAELDGLTNTYVFPHMGDGGLALGAAMGVNYEQFGVGGYPLKGLSLGPRFSPQEIIPSLRRFGYPYRQIENVAEQAARLILDGEIILWFQGRMEIGPRALGNRSILARPDDNEVKNRLNLALKKRVWYQPFCPAILFEDAPDLLEMGGQDSRDNPFMTMAFKVRGEQRALMEGVINVDGTCRPQVVSDENPRYRDLLVHIKKALGKGVILNTSFNVHGDPIVCSPDDALNTLRKTGVRYLFLEDFLVQNTDAKNL